MKYIVCIIQSRCKLNSLNWYNKSLYSKIILFDISENGRGNFNSRESFLFSLHAYWQGPLDRPVHHEISRRPLLMNRHTPVDLVSPLTFENLVTDMGLTPHVLWPITCAISNGGSYLGFSRIFCWKVFWSKSIYSVTFDLEF